MLCVPPSFRPMVAQLSMSHFISIIMTTHYVSLLSHSTLFMRLTGRTIVTAMVYRAQKQQLVNYGHSKIKWQGNV